MKSGDKEIKEFQAFQDQRRSLVHILSNDKSNDASFQNNKVVSEEIETKHKIPKINEMPTTKTNVADIDYKKLPAIKVKTPSSNSLKQMEIRPQSPVPSESSQSSLSLSTSTTSSESPRSSISASPEKSLTP
ncbi:hypothetical protein SNE40_005101 [Patella caerulea]